MVAAASIPYSAFVSNPSPDQIAKALIQVITEERKAQGLTYEQLADRAGGGCIGRLSPELFGLAGDCAL